MNYNEESRKSLMKIINSMNRPILVSVEVFFDGNYDESSIGVNLLDHPGIEYFSKKLSDLKENSSVKDVLVEIYDIDEGYWPYAEKVWIVTKLEQEEIIKLTEGLKFDEIENEDLYDTEIPPGYSVFSLWWD